MNKIKNSGFFRSISLILILTFISLDISYAYPPERNAGNSALATPSLLQQQPINEHAARFQQSVFSQSALIASVYDIGEYFFGSVEKGVGSLPSKHAEDAISADLGKHLNSTGIEILNIVPIEYIKKTTPEKLRSALDEMGFNGTLPDEGVVFILYKKDGKKFLVQIAEKDKVSTGNLPGYEWVISDKYLVKYIPEDYSKKDSRLQTVDQRPQTKAQISEPIAEVVAPVNKVETPENAGITHESSRISVRAIIKYVVAVVIMLASLFMTPMMGRSAAQALDNRPDPVDLFSAIVDPLSTSPAAAWLVSAFFAISDFTVSHPDITAAIELSLVSVVFFLIWHTISPAERHSDRKYEIDYSSINAVGLTSGHPAKPQNVKSITASVIEELKIRKEVSPSELFVIVQSGVPGSMNRLRAALETLKPLSEVEGVSMDVMLQEISLAASIYILSEEESRVLRLALIGPGQGQGTGNEAEDNEHSRPKKEAKAPEALRLFDTIESSLNNGRDKFIATGNSIVDLYAAKAGTDDVAGVVGINRKMTTIEIEDRVKRAIAGIEESERDAMSADTKAAIDMLRKNMNQFEADGGVASLIVLARRAKREDQKLIIGLETDWIPSVTTKGSLQRSAINVLMTEMRDMENKLKSMGLDVKIIHGSGAKLAHDLKNMRDATGTDLHNIVVMASVGTIDSSDFDWLRNADESDRPFLAGIDPAKLIELYSKFGEDTKNQLHIKLMGLLYRTLELAAGKELPQNKGVDYYDYDRKLRRITFFPDASRKDYEILRNTYAAEKTAWVAA